MKLEQTSIPGCFLIFPKVQADKRGRFVKTFHIDWFAEHGLITSFAEEYYSVSKKGVLRGLHFQTPPHEHVKLVSCVKGLALDAIVDLRIGSPTCGRFETFQISAETANMLYIAHGIAHGFYALTDDVIMKYKVTSVYKPDSDCGIKWNSAGIPWPDTAPIVSERDDGFLTLSAYDSPFSFGE